MRMKLSPLCENSKFNASPIIIMQLFKFSFFFSPFPVEDYLYNIFRIVFGTSSLEVAFSDVFLP